MGLFGPLGDTRLGIYEGGPASTGGANIFGMDPGALDDAEYVGSQRRLTGLQWLRARYPYAGAGMPAMNAIAPPATAPAATPAVPGIIAPLPSMQTLGGFTTRRTQFFGPLASVAI
jgi:hypothetical protein